jgi:small-conductance mechanosensitive channel
MKRARRARDGRLRAAALGLLLIVAVASPPAFGKGADGDSTIDAEITAPVVVDGDVLFRVRGTSSLPAAERAARIAASITGLAGDPEVRPENVRVVEAGEYLRIAAGDRPVVTLADADAALEHVSLRALADLHRNRIARAIEEYRSARTPERLLRAALRALAATAAVIFAVGLVLWLARRLRLLVDRRFGSRIKSLEIQSFELVRAEHIWGGVRALLRALAALVILAVGFIYLHNVLGLFPWTRGYALGLGRAVLGPLRDFAWTIVVNIPNFLFLTILFFIVRFAVRMAHLFFDAIGRRAVTFGKFDPEWAVPTYKIVRLAIVAIGLIIAYPYIPGSQSAAFKGVSLLLGVVFSLGSSSAISNLVAGYTMTYRRAFKLGDRVKIGETIGDVIEMRLQVTHLRSLKNEEVIVPNSQILNNEIVNYSSLAKEQGLILHTTVGIGYEVPWRQVEAMLLMAVERTPGLLKEPAPFVLHRRLADFAVDYEVNAYIRDAHEMMPLYTALHRSILDVFNEYGVQIMTPEYESDPEQPKVVPKDQWYAAPARRDGIEPRRGQAAESEEIRERTAHGVAELKNR